MKILKRVVTIVIVIATLVAAIFAADNLLPSYARSALPATATDVHEFHESSGCQGDGSRLLKAKMPESEMPGFAARLGLSQRYSPSISKSTPTIFGGDGSNGWWDPPATLTGAYLRSEPGKDSSEVAVYHNGYVYYEAYFW